MALFRATVKRVVSMNNVRLEPGMQVEFSSMNFHPLSVNEGKEVIDAFQRVYGVDIKAARANSSMFIDVEKISK
jgi:hypothetical protein